MIIDTICPWSATVTRVIVPDAPLMLPAPRPQLLLCAPKIAGLLMPPAPVKQSKPILSLVEALADRLTLEMYYEEMDRFAVVVSPSAARWLPRDDKHERKGKRRDPRRPVRANVERYWSLAA